MITDLLIRNAGDGPTEAFLWTDEGSYSYADCLTAVRRFAHVLQAHGVRKGDHVAILADNSACYVIALLGISWLGAVFVALNNELVSDGLRYSLAQSDAKLIVADRRWLREKQAHLDEALQRLPVIVLEEERRFFEGLTGLPEAEPASAGGDDACGILYTSGTTGLPKGVVLSHDCYKASGRDLVAALGLEKRDRVMTFLPLFHTNPQFLAMMPALWAGASIIVRERFSATSFFADARRFGATGFTFVGTVMSILANRYPGPQREHGLRFAMGGGTPIDIWENIQERFGFRIHEGYGMTEIGCWVACNTDAAYRTGSCGRPRACMDVRIFDEHDRELPAGTTGEIVVRPKEANVILSGYYRQPEVLVQSSRNLWFHTGDRGMLDTDGYLYFRGRTKELIRRGGEMISPVEIENKLRGMPGVKDCAAVGVPDVIMGEEIKMVVVTDAPISPAEIAAYLCPLLPRYMIPRYIEFLDKIPKTETEKVLRQSLLYLNSEVHDLAAQRGSS